MLISSIQSIQKILPSNTNIQKNTALQGQLKADTVSFSSAINPPKLPFKNSGEEELCRNLIKKLYGDECDISPYRTTGFPARFDVTHKNCYDEGIGSLIYDENNKLKDISIQEYDLDGFRCVDGHLKVYDMDGNLNKILTPQQSETLRAYRGMMATTLNYHLRHDNMVPYFEPHLKNMDDLFKNPMCHEVLDKDIVVHRGIKVNDYTRDYFADNLSVGKIFEEKGFLSTTTNKNRVDHYGNYFLEIHVPKGTKYLDMTKLTSPSEYFIKEDEFVFNRNTKLLPVDFNYDTNTFTLKMLPESE